MSIRTILFASVLACLGAVVGQESAAHAQPVMPPAPSPSYAPPAQPAQGYPAPAQQAYPPPAQPAQGYPPPQQPAPAYPAPQQQPAQGYPPPQQPASSYPQPGQPYPPQGYPPPQQPQGYPPPQQPQGYPPPQQGYPPPQVEQAPPPPAPAAEVKRESVFANPLSKLQVGFHLGMGSLTTDKTSSGADYSSDLMSFGIFARYRFNQRWEAELAVASESGTVSANDAVRDFTPITASALFHVIDLRGVDVYGRAGLGRGTEVYANPAYSPLEGPTTHFHLGAGASYLFRRNIAAGAELRWNRIARGDGDLSPLTGSGTVYGAYGAYHF